MCREMKNSNVDIDAIIKENFELLKNIAINKKKFFDKYGK
jgi:hypothetical protein